VSPVCGEPWRKPGRDHKSYPNLTNRPVGLYRPWMTASPVTRADRSRRAILDAALPIFARDGYTAASLNQIIEASGLTKGGFYFHFPSKQALALAVVADDQQRWIEQVRGEISKHHRAVDRMFAAPRVIARYALHGQGPAALGKLIEELARDPDLRDEVCGSIEVWVRTVAEHYAAARAEGTVQADLEPDQFAQVAVGGFLGMRALSDQLADGHFVERVEAFIEMVQRAVLTPRASGKRRAQ
jgi:AcrR family transcriptional regulator